MIGDAHARRADSNNHSLGDKEESSCALALVCSNGVLLPNQTSVIFNPRLDWQQYQGRTVSAADGFLIPSGRESDTLLCQPPLALKLNEGAIAALLRAEHDGVLAATILGPPQEKSRNEDFALAASFLDRDGTHHGLVVVADGVTTKTFWPERASRIAALVALQVVAKYVEGGPTYSVPEIDAFRQELSQKLQFALDLDRRWLSSYQSIPTEWSSESFNKYSMKGEYWYNSTLLLTVVSEKGAMILWTGDGAIQITKNFRNGHTEVSTPLQSSDEVNVSNVVSLSGPILFFGGRIDMNGSLNDLCVTLCTDGPDRTIQRNELRNPFYTALTSRAMTTRLEDLANLQNREVDNYSAALVRWPRLKTPQIDFSSLDDLLWSASKPSPIAERNSIRAEKVESRTQNSPKQSVLGERIRRFV